MTSGSVPDVSYMTLETHYKEHYTLTRNQSENYHFLKNNSRTLYGLLRPLKTNKPF